MIFSCLCSTKPESDPVWSKKYKYNWHKIIGCVCMMSWQWVENNETEQEMGGWFSEFWTSTKNSLKIFFFSPVFCTLFSPKPNQRHMKQTFNPTLYACKVLKIDGWKIWKLKSFCQWRTHKVKLVNNRNILRAAEWVLQFHLF